MNTPVSFEIAKLLKEKGFDNYTVNFYTKPNSKMFGIDEKGRYYPIKNKSKSLWITGNAATLNDKNVYNAPTIAEVVMWLYEKHSLWILPLPTVTCRFAYKIIDVQCDPSNEIERPPYTKVSANDFNSPREAYEAAIEYTLNNLI